MKISLTKAGKRFNRDWIFRNLSYEFIAGTAYAITGPNGSGKSTLLQAIAGAMGLSEGVVEFQSIVDSRKSIVGLARRSDSEGGSRETLDVRRETTETSTNNSFKILPEEAYQHISIAAPYLELVEEMTAMEMFRFHHQFKPLLPGRSWEEIINIIGLFPAANKQIRYFSSGMKQRMKLALAIFSDVPVVLLDEPCTNLDTEGIQLYQKLIGEHGSGRLIIVSSNDEAEYGFCPKQLSILDYK